MCVCVCVCVCVCGCARVFTVGCVMCMYVCECVGVNVIRIWGRLLRSGDDGVENRCIGGQIGGQRAHPHNRR